jgi:hypothetical protein
VAVAGLATLLVSAALAVLAVEEMVGQPHPTLMVRQEVLVLEAAVAAAATVLVLAVLVVLE